MGGVLMAELYFIVIAMTLSFICICCTMNTFFNWSWNILKKTGHSGSAFCWRSSYNFYSWGKTKDFLRNNKVHNSKYYMHILYLWYNGNKECCVYIILYYIILYYIILYYIILYYIILYLNRSINCLTFLQNYIVWSLLTWPSLQNLSLSEHILEDLL